MKRLGYALVCAAVLAVSVPTLASGGDRRGGGLPSGSLPVDCKAVAAIKPAYQLCLQLLKAATPVGTVVATGTIDASSPNGTRAKLPFPADYRIDVSGTWTNTGDNWLDAEYVSTPAATRTAGTGSERTSATPRSTGRSSTGARSSAGHSYSHTGSYERSVDLAVFVGVGGTKMPAWYADNSGFLSYTITYVG